MYARLGFSVAVNVDPDILLIDEVLAVGDEVFQRRCAAKITELRNGGRTVVIVSHALGTLRTMCDRVAWFEHGAIAGIGTPSETIDGYLATVHPTAVVDDRGKTRTGSGASRVQAHVSDDLRTGGPATISFSIDSTETLPSAMLAFVFRRTDGIVSAGTATTASQIPAGLAIGRSTVVYEVPNLVLLPGTYDLGVRLTDATGGTEFDICDHECRLDVGPSESHEPAFGVSSLFGRWVTTLVHPGSTG